METSSEKRSNAKVFGTWKKSDFSGWQNFIHSPALMWLFFLVVCFIITFLLSFHLETLPIHIRVGAIAQKDIRADQDYEFIDEDQTQENRIKAVGNILPVYDYDQAISFEIDRRIAEAFERARVLLNQTHRADPAESKDLFEKATGVSLSEEAVGILAQNQFNSELETLLRDAVHRAMSDLIVDDTSGIRKLPNQKIIVRPVRAVNIEEASFQKEAGQIPLLSQLRMNLLEKADRLFRTRNQIAVSPEALAQISGDFLRPNLSYNIAETEARKKKASDSQEPVKKVIQAGQSIIRNGEQYTSEHLRTLRQIHTQNQQSNPLVKFIGTYLFVALFLFITYSFAARYIRKFRPTRTDLLFMGSHLVAILIFLRIFSAVASGVHDLPFIDAQTLYYAIPIAAGTMLVRLVLNSETAIIFGVILSVLSGFYFKGEPDLTLYFIISSIAGAGSIAYADRRSAILKAGVITGVVNVMILLSFRMAHVVALTQKWDVVELLALLAAGFIGGTNSALYVLFYTPIVEMVFGYTTDIKLLELGNLNHPLLKEMIVKAPGTYHHSQLVAVLCEAAAESIGANPILARVGAYFHDIGKMAKPLYFIENQMGGENRHDRLVPSMSALIISSHVKDGMEMAEQCKLPKIIADMIPQHQGTKLMTFFYNKAKEAERSDFHVVNEEDYRYPGPRPQTRESGILLLADGVEAAVRSLPEKTPAKIQAMVQKMINKSFAEEQLEECDLTLKDLRIIANSFARVLIGIYHQRVAYPDVEERKAAPVLIKKLEVISNPEPRRIAPGGSSAKQTHDPQKPSIPLQGSSS